MHRLLDSKLGPVLLMDAGAGHRVGAVVGCLRKLQNWCTSAILDEYRRYAIRLFQNCFEVCYSVCCYRYTGDKARDSVEHFMELFDTDLVHVPAIRPSWM